MVGMLSSARTWKLAALVAGLMLSGCSNHSPAPVMSLGKDYNSLERGSYRGSYYEVQKGDTLYFISYITGRDVDDIIASNKLSKPYTIFPGQKLQLWRPKYVAPKYGRVAPAAVAAAPAAKSSTKTTNSKPAQPKPAATAQTATQPASQKQIGRAHV